MRVLTIIIPAYNMESYLERCLSSLVLEKEYMSLFEAIIINDGSKDRTSEIGHFYQKEYPETFRVIDKINGHYGSCINRGISEAKGIFIKVLDADDSFDSLVFIKYLSFLSRNEVILSADAILSDYIQVDDNLTLLSEHTYDSYNNPVSIANLSNNDKAKWFIHGLAYRTELLKAIHYQQTEGVAYTDIEWCFYPAAVIQHIYRFEGFLYRYTKMREDQSVSPAIQGKRIGEQIGLVEKMITSSANLSSLCINEDNLFFLKDTLKLNVSHIYQIYLITLHRFISSDKRLLGFDQKLKQVSPILYDEVNDYSTLIAGLRFKPIKLWREHRILLLRIMQVLYSLADYYSIHKRDRTRKRNQAL